MTAYTLAGMYRISTSTKGDQATIRPVFLIPLPTGALVCAWFRKMMCDRRLSLRGRALLRLCPFSGAVPTRRNYAVLCTGLRGDTSPPTWVAVGKPEHLSRLTGLTRIESVIWKFKYPVRLPDVYASKRKEGSTAHGV